MYSFSLILFSLMQSAAETNVKVWRSSMTRFFRANHVLKIKFEKKKESSWCQNVVGLPLYSFFESQVLQKISILFGKYVTVRAAH